MESWSKILASCEGSFTFPLPYFIKMCQHIFKLGFHAVQNKIKKNKNKITCCYDTRTHLSLSFSVRF